MRILHVVFALIGVVLLHQQADAQSARPQPAPALRPGAIPLADVTGTRDSRALPRFQGSVLLGSAMVAFDEVLLPNAELVRAGERRDARNNALFLPPDPLKVEGRRTRLVYLVPEGRSPLEVVRGYQQAARDAGGTSLFECAAEACGGSHTNSATAGGNASGVINMLIPRDEVPTTPGHPVACAMDGRANQRYALIKLPNDAGHAAVLSYVMADVVAGSECKAWVGRTVALVVVVEKAAREQRMETVSAAAMAGSVERDGRVALYAVTFETDKAELRAESAVQLDEIAAYLKASGSQRVLIVGHTDSQGALDYNTDLSRRRAAAVVAALVRRSIPAARMTPIGVGMASPVATNESDEGRAKNRRVELVRQ
jgi:OmpA-OmpF porin, OOP family